MNLKESKFLKLFLKPFQIFIAVFFIFAFNPSPSLKRFVQELFLLISKEKQKYVLAILTMFRTRFQFNIVNITFKTRKKNLKKTPENYRVRRVVG